jgi:ABC-type Fe3+-hydroxamate transport system substrate-binding protein
MNRKTIILQLSIMSAMIVIVLVNLSGCTTNQNENQRTNNTVNTLLGTWVGTLQIPMFGGRSNTSISQITFTSTLAEMTLSNQERTYSMNYSYTINGNSLILTPIMTNRNGFPGGQPFNRSTPPNGTHLPGNWSGSPNGTQPPGNRTWPFNGSRPSGDTRPSMTITLTYIFDVQTKELYLNNAQFTKVE